MFDVIVNEVKKYSANPEKLKRKQIRVFEQHDAIVLARVMIEGGKVMNASRFNLQNGIHVKQIVKQRKSEAKCIKFS